MKPRLNRENVVKRYFASAEVKREKFGLIATYHKLLHFDKFNYLCPF